MENEGLKDYEVDYLRYLRKKHNMKAHWGNRRNDDGIDLSLI